VQRISSIAVVALLAAAGCGGGGEDEWAAKRPATVPASGTLTFNGEGVEGATVILAPANATGGEVYGASAVTGSGGSFEFSAFPPEPGAVPGQYQVGVTKVESQQAAAPAEGAHSDTSLPPPKNLLPEQFSDPTKSGITLEIPAGGKTDIKLDLK
jgi:hypothetical protein